MKTPESQRTTRDSLWPRLVRWISDREVEFDSAIWRRVPAKIAESGIGHNAGRVIHRRIQRLADRHQATTTYFLRNRAELALMCRLLDEQLPGPRLDIAVLGCSKGAEVYSVASFVRKSRPDLDLRIHAVDINREVVEFAKCGVYSVLFGDARCAGSSKSGSSAAEIATKTFQGQPSSPFVRMTAPEFEEMFEVSGNQACVRPHLREGITWHVLDANSSGLLEMIGPQDIVLANRFLCHMAPAESETCLKNAMSLVKPGGFLFVSGIDLDVRANTTKKMGWEPVILSIKEIHEGDPSVLAGWPLSYWGLEPFDASRPDWTYRYASVFQNPKADNSIILSPAAEGSAMQKPSVPRELRISLVEGTD